MIGKRWWILIWYGILLLGVVGLIMAINWGRHIKWRNLDEILRGVGTITCSVGMLLLLHGGGGGAGQTLLLAALISFFLAFIVGREQERQRPRSHSDDQ
ncbi:MAG TPA: hypothetical protein PLL69_06315 [Gemmatimonadales bacterium]|nr:hypothetical protein [Gemmatimonadales bacterium]